MDAPHLQGLRSRAGFVHLVAEFLEDAASQGADRLVILEHTEVVLPEHLPAELRLGTRPNRRSLIQLPPDGVALADVERELVCQAMERAGGNQSHAAELLGIERDALRRRLIKYGYLTATTGELNAAKC